MEQTHLVDRSDNSAALIEHIYLPGMSKSQVDDTVKIIVKAGAGVDNIDVEEASRRGIQVLTTPASATAVAELSLLLLLAVRRRLLTLMQAMRSGN